MLKIIIAIAVVGLAVVLSVPRTREALIESIKAATDILVVWSLRITSQFGSELTEDGKGEQKLWRERRLRDLQGLALRSRQRWGNK